MDKEFQLKVADFGFSAAVDIMHTYVGTVSYMAPEIVTDRREGYTKACDVWSCGVILFIMYLAAPPYQSPKSSDWWFQKLQVGRLCHHSVVFFFK
jgi:calcium-dependent protein kinase